jgi:hypothetical protein
MKLAIVIALVLACGTGCTWLTSIFGGAVVEIEAPDGGSVRIELPRVVELVDAGDAAR